MPDRRYRVLAVATHPVQYMAPVFRRMAAHPRFDLHVAYCSLRGAEAAHDPEFGATVQWDVPLLEGYSWSHIPNHGSGAETFLGLRNPRLSKLIRDGNYDAVLCFVGYLQATFWIAYRAARSSKTAFLFGTDTNTLCPRDGRMWKRTVKKILWPHLFRLADQVIVPSSGARDLMVSLGLPADRVTLTPYSVDNDWWMKQSATVDRTAVRGSWGASAADAVILFCAKLQPWKRPGDLLRAFAEAQLADALLVIAGEGPLRGELESQAEALGMGKRVRILGFVNQSQLPAVYASADLMVLPSEYEPFAVVVNEAMCCGCPVAASDRVGAARDLVAPVRREFVFPCGDVAALTVLLKEAVVDRARLASLGRSAIAHMHSWSPERNIAATLEAIEIAANRKVRRSAAAIQDSSATDTSPAVPQKFRE
ncbi:MAG TPA: glycosyltransferase family 4 protein [Candidatus Acidoferrum sp.]|nr:glycosyltransferase family 4 protein [Candidatus Acidoferrum sp.]